MTEYVFHRKSNLVKINLDNLNLIKPDLKNVDTSKANAVANWIMAWIDEGLASKKIKIGMLLPTKQELAYFLGVSIGTIQNALRYVEDMNYVESKQRIGTIIKDKNSQVKNIRKLTSKRENAISEIKNYIIKNKIKVGSILPSSRALAALIHSTLNTTRLALEYLVATGIIENSTNKPTEKGWKIKSLDFSDKTISKLEQETLVSKIEKDIKLYIDENLKPGDKIPSHNEMADMFKVSMKTVHDALKNLVTDGILITRRGRYGTVVAKLPKEINKFSKVEQSIFAPAQETAFYYYEKTQNIIKNMIAQNYEIGSKLPSIMALSKAMDLSPNTIRKAFHNLAKEGYLIFSRGRYGGTFVVDIPSVGEETFKWLAVNPEYAETFNN